jgi:hypothetical protein
MAPPSSLKLPASIGYKVMSCAERLRSCKLAKGQTIAFTASDLFGFLTENYQSTQTTEPQSRDKKHLFMVGLNILWRSMTSQLHNTDSYRGCKNFLVF